MTLHNIVAFFTCVFMALPFAFLTSQYWEERPRRLAFTPFLFCVAFMTMAVLFAITIADLP